MDDGVIMSPVSVFIVPGLQGNKGGVGARFNLFHSSLCFVNCHFAASMEEVDKRNHVSAHPPSLPLPNASLPLPPPP